MSNESFKTNYAKLLAKAGNKAETVVRKTALELQSSLVSKSPVDTGRFKGNWVAAIGTVNKSTSDTQDKTPLGQYDPGKSYASTQAVLKGWKPGQTITLTNSLPYAKRLEYGWSQQAPSGMVALTVQNYSASVARSVAELK